MLEKCLRGLAYLAVICLCLLRIHSYWQNYHTGAKPSPRSLASRLVGSRIGLKEDRGGEATRGTMVIAMTTVCVFCRASAPFFRKLLQDARGLPWSVRTIAVMPESKDVASGYIRDSLELKFDDVVQHLPGFAPQFTPTLLVADQEGVVKGAWVGVPKPAAEEEIMAALCGVGNRDGAPCGAR
jgi:thiol-disulfide isomerase/thioredoxin